MSHHIDSKLLFSSFQLYILLYFLAILFNQCESKQHHCVTKVGCYRLMIQKPMCGNGTIAYNSGDYTVELLIKGCKNRHRKNFHIAWHETLKSNEDVEFEECRNKRKCSLKQSWLNQEQLHNIGIRIQLANLHKVVKLSVKLVVQTGPSKSYESKKLSKFPKTKSKTNSDVKNRHKKNRPWGETGISKVLSNQLMPSIQNKSKSYVKIVSHESQSIGPGNEKEKLKKRNDNTSDNRTLMPAESMKENSVNGSMLYKKAGISDHIHKVNASMIDKWSLKNGTRSNILETLHSRNLSHFFLLKHNGKKSPIITKSVLNSKGDNQVISVVPLSASYPDNKLLKNYCIVITQNGQKHFLRCPKMTKSRVKPSDSNGTHIGFRVRSHQVQSRLHPSGVRYNVYKNEEITRFLNKTNVLLSSLEKQQRSHLLCTVTNLSAPNSTLLVSHDQVFNCGSVSNTTQEVFIVRQKENEKLLKNIKRSVLLLLKEFDVTRKDLKLLQALSKKSALLLLKHLSEVRKLSRDGNYLPAKVGQMTADVLRKLYLTSYLAAKRALNDSRQETGTGSPVVRTQTLHVLTAKWASWSQWMPCSISCGMGGTRQRRRVCIGVNKKLQCQGGKAQSSPCPYLECPGIAKWSSWGSWTKCSATCGHAYTARSRSCLVTGKSKEMCSGRGTEFKACKLRVCPAPVTTTTKTIPMAIRGHWSHWGAWSHCPVTCGMGVEKRVRRCRRPLQAWYYPTRKVHCSGKGTVKRSCIMSSCNTAPVLHEVLEGHDATLRCAIDDSEDMDHIYWVTPKGQKITINSNYNRYQIGDGFLTIKNAQRFDKGTYHCVVLKLPDHQWTADSMIEVTTCRSSPCLNGASCIEDVYPDYPHHHHLKCVCPSGFEGPLCKQKTGVSTELALIIGLSVAGCVLIILGVIICFLWYRKKEKKSVKKVTQTDFSNSKSNICTKKSSRPSSKSSCKKSKTNPGTHEEGHPLLCPNDKTYKHLNTSVVSSDDSFVEINHKDFENEQYIFDMHRNNGTHTNSVPVFSSVKPLSSGKHTTISAPDNVPKDYSVVRNTRKSNLKKMSSTKDSPMRSSDVRATEDQLQSEMGLYDDVVGLVNALPSSKARTASSSKRSSRRSDISHDAIYENMQMPQMTSGRLRSDKVLSSLLERDNDPRMIFSDRDFELYHTMGAPWNSANNFEQKKTVSDMEKDGTDFEVVHRVQYSEGVRGDKTGSISRQYQKTTSYNQNNYTDTSKETERNMSNSQDITENGQRTHVEPGDKSPFSLNLGDLLDSFCDPVHTDDVKDPPVEELYGDPEDSAQIPASFVSEQQTIDNHDSAKNTDDAIQLSPNTLANMSPRTRMCMDHYQMVYGPIAYRSPREGTEEAERTKVEPHTYNGSE